MTIVTRFGTTPLGQELNAIVEHIKKAGGREWQKIHILRRLPVNMGADSFAKLINEELEISDVMIFELLVCYEPYGGEVFFHMNVEGNVADEISDATYTFGNDEFEQKNILGYIDWMNSVIEKVSSTQL